MNDKLRAALHEIEKEVQDRTLSLLVTGLEPFVGSIHIEEWAPNSWARFVRLALASGLSTDLIMDECGVSLNEIDSWLAALRVPEERVRQTVIRLALGREPQ